MAKRKIVDLGKVFRDNLKIYRSKKGMSQRALGRKAGVSGVFVYQIECGLRTPTMETVSKIAEALGESPNTLLGDPNKL